MHSITLNIVVKLQTHIFNAYYVSKQILQITKKTSFLIKDRKENKLKIYSTYTQNLSALHSEL